MRLFGRPKGCKRCAEIRAEDASSLGLFFKPGIPRDVERERIEGERVRAMALAMHAAAGHPTERDYRS